MHQSQIFLISYGAFGNQGMIAFLVEKNSSPHQIFMATMALDESSKLNDASPDGTKTYSLQQNTTNSTLLPLQGQTIRTDLLISGAKIYSDASFKCTKIPGLTHGQTATGIGVYLNSLQDQRSTQVQIQASTEPTFSPLQAEAHALVLAARVTQLLQISQPMFLTDNLSLAKAAASKNVLADAIPWSIRKLIAEFYNTTRQLQSQVFHISREINGIAQNVAH